LAGGKAFNSGCSAPQTDTPNTARPTITDAWPLYAPRPDGIWQENEYVLSPKSTVDLAYPAGNAVPGHLTAENNASHLFIAIDAEDDLSANQTDGVSIGFDTDANGAATPNADDIYQANETQGQRLLYDNGLGAWAFSSWCSAAPPTGDITVPACSPARTMRPSMISISSGRSTKT
jgi:hypothetical protein